MAYRLNHIELSSYGITPGQAPGSNVAITGFLDLPKRTGKVYHPWPEGDGVQAWVDADHIGFEGRDIVLHALIMAADEQAAYDLLHTFYDTVSAFTDLVELETPYGTFNVWAKDDFKVTYHQQGLFTAELKFREPQPVINGAIPFEPSPAALRDMIDGIGLDTLALKFLKWEGESNRPGGKSLERVAHLKESYHVLPSGPRKLVLSLLAEADNIGELIANVKALHALFAQVGTNELVIDREVIADFIVAEGMTVNQVHVADSQAVAKLTINIMVMQENWTTVFTDQDGFIITDDEGSLMAMSNTPAPITVVNLITHEYTGHFTHVNAVASADLGLIGLPLLDGVALTEEMLVYARVQANPTERKVYTVKAGAWEELAGVDYEGYLIFAAGDANGGRIYLCEGDDHVTSDESITENMAAGSVLIVTYPTANTAKIEIRQLC